MVGQGHNVLVEPDGNQRNTHVRVCLSMSEYLRMCVCVYVNTYLEGLV